MRRIQGEGSGTTATTATTTTNSNIPEDETVKCVLEIDYTHGRCIIGI